MQVMVFAVVITRGLSERDILHTVSDCIAIATNGEIALYCTRLQIIAVIVDQLGRLALQSLINQVDETILRRLSTSWNTLSAFTLITLLQYR
jgi:hypothetical protein